MRTKLRTVDVRDGLDKVREALRSEAFHHVPILDGKHLVGIISSRDLVRVFREAFNGEEGKGKLSDSGRTTIEGTMQTDLVTLRSDESVEKAIDVLADGAIHSVLVLDESDELKGIVTNIDLLEYLFD
jgi:CBS domain-containing protein